MTARILVVDDVPANIKLLAVKLTTEYYEVLSASSGEEAIALSKEQKPDIILLDVMMPDMNGYETCQAIKEDPELSYIPIVMVTALSDSEDKVKGLAVGADDFLTKPVNDWELMARIRSLLRLKVMTDQLRVRNQTSVEFGLVEALVEKVGNEIEEGKVLVVEDDIVECKHLKAVLTRPNNEIVMVEDPVEALNLSDNQDFDVILVSTQLCDMDGLRLSSLFRSHDATRNTPILMLVEEDEDDVVVKGLDMGINDYVKTPIDDNELIARVNTQIRHKKFQDAMTHSMEESMSMAVKDGLTGLYNRRYFDVHVGHMMLQARENNKRVALLMMDIDHFKEINDTHGHQAGDQILQKVTRRIEDCLRTSDLIARYGGEEFVAVVNNTNDETAKRIAERIRTYVGITPFIVEVENEEKEIEVTVSIGMGLMEDEDTETGLVSRADKALYEAKDTGRDRVVFG